MNKDAVLATVIGFGVGLIIAALVFLGPTLFKNFPQIRLPDIGAMISNFQKGSNANKPTPTPKPGDTLTIQSPLPDAIEPQNEALISGTAPPNALIVIEGETTENVVVANASGSFAGKITLREGKNEIQVTSHLKDVTQTQSVTVYYTSEDF